MVSEENTTGLHVDSAADQMLRIVRDYKIFWTTMPIELAGGEGRPLKVGMALALVGTDAESGITGDTGGEPTVYDKLYELARWLTAGNEQDVRFEIRRHDNIVFFLPDDLKTKRKDYVVVIRILHGDQFNLPLDKSQLDVLGGLEKKLKDIGSPKDHWKKQPVNQI